MLGRARRAIAVGADLDERIIGDLVRFHYQPEHGSAEMGWNFHRDDGELGYATEAARARSGVGFDELGLRRITARIDELRVASSRLADRLGMRLEARLGENEWFKIWSSTEVDYASSLASGSRARRPQRRRRPPRPALHAHARSPEPEPRPRGA